MKRKHGGESDDPRKHSASGISLAKQCRHAWALCYLDGIRKPELSWAEIAAAEAKGLRITEYGGQRGAALGKEVHARAERYVVKGAKRIEWDDLPGQVLRELIDHLPPAGTVPADAVEHEFEVELCGVIWRGLIDMYLPDGTPGARGADRGVWDHKTTRDILKYALLPDAVARAYDAEYGADGGNWIARSIRNDLQACLYVLYTAVRRALRPGDSVPVHWNYTETDRVRRSLPVLEHIECTHALGIVKAAAAIAKECETYENSDDALPETLSCGDYGGCWYRGRHCFAERDYGRLLHRFETTGKV